MQLEVTEGDAVVPIKARKGGVSVSQRPWGAPGVLRHLHSGAGCPSSGDGGRTMLSESGPKPLMYV